MNSYVALDLENPNSKGNSICEIALVVVEDGEIKKEWSSLINPEDFFDIRNSEITGLSASAVTNAPTLPECWEEICSIIKGRVLLGHNITYDLNVLKKALERYKIVMPEIQYLCTLVMSQKVMEADSYKLSHLCHLIGYEYDAHHAKNDAVAAVKLYEYLKRKGSCDNIRIFDSTVPSQKKDKIEEHLVTNINELNGLIIGILANEEVGPQEMKRLITWADNNQVNRIYRLFDEIICIIETITEDEFIDQYELGRLTGLVDYINHSRVYNETTLGLQQLYGILDGITCDSQIDDAEVNVLNRWLQKHDYLTGVYPYDKLYLQVQSVLEDGIISDQERDEMMHTFTEMLHPVQEGHHDIDLAGKTFCLTGEFLFGSKAEVKAKLESYGAIEKNGVSAKLDYLFAGGAGSSAWKFGTAGGGKIKKAQELQEKGSNIQIIPESDMSDLLGI